MTIYINGRFLTQNKTGVQKFALEQTIKLANKYDVCVLLPRGKLLLSLPESIQTKTLGWFQGHVWEQIMLPIYLYLKGNPLLFSFSGLSPIFYFNSFLTIHDLSFRYEKRWFNWKYRWWYSFSYYILSRTCRGIITVSKFSKDEIIKYFPHTEGKIFVVYNTIPNVSEKIKETGQDRKGNYILAVSSLDPRKNFDSLVLAFSLLQQNDYTLKIVGAKYSVFHNSRIESIISNNKVTFLGYVTDNELEILYQNAAFFIYPSLYEGFGIPPLEAMSYGCPVLCSDIPSINEICSDAVTYFDPSSVPDIAEKMNMLIQNKKSYSAISNRGFQRLAELKVYEKKLSILKVVHETITG